MDGMKKLIERLNKCVAVIGEYVEKCVHSTFLRIKMFYADCHREILLQCDSIFSEDKYDVGHLRIEPRSIVLKSYLPVHFRLYRTSPIAEKEIKDRVEKLLQAGLIKESNSPYSVPGT
ncbi:uncharacterized protein TNCV_4197591 [Trichonephila clavipes]|nr:uncharacterized protein TNCV_4197591 [Trichonephila clavipes]